MTRLVSLTIHWGVTSKLLRQNLTRMEILGHALLLTNVYVEVTLSIGFLCQNVPMVILKFPATRSLTVATYAVTEELLTLVLLVHIQPALNAMALVPVTRNHVVQQVFLVTHALALSSHMQRQQALAN